jgi:hypothetical protein
MPAPFDPRSSDSVRRQPVWNFRRAPIASLTHLTMIVTSLTAVTVYPIAVLRITERDRILSTDLTSKIVRGDFYQSRVTAILASMGPITQRRFAHILWFYGFW